MNHPFLAAGFWNAFAAGFGVTAAILAIGGIILLRWQRNRNELSLLRAAMEKGVSVLPPGPPLWLLSLRQGVMILALGVGLCAVGAVGWAIAARVPPPASPTTVPAAATEPVGPIMQLPGRDEQPRPRPVPREAREAREAWERAVRQQTLCMALVGGGGILVLLGVVRTGFARVERRHTTEKP